MTHPLDVITNTIEQYKTECPRLTAVMIFADLQNAGYKIVKDGEAGAVSVTPGGVAIGGNGGQGGDGQGGKGGSAVVMGSGLAIGGKGGDA